MFIRPSQIKVLSMASLVDVELNFVLLTILCLSSALAFTSPLLGLSCFLKRTPSSPGLVSTHVVLFIDVGHAASTRSDCRLAIEASSVGRDARTSSFLHACNCATDPSLLVPPAVVGYLYILNRSRYGDSRSTRCFTNSSWCSSCWRSEGSSNPFRGRDGKFVKGRFACQAHGAFIPSCIPFEILSPYSSGSLVFLHSEDCASSSSRFSPGGPHSTYPTPAQTVIVLRLAFKTFCPSATCD